jgi:APA family basic amino acid/polyamine antiporter
MSNNSGGLKPHIGFRSATALVIANVIGAGIFTTTGFQAADLGNPYLILLLWVIGGVLAYCGALCYGELGAAMPQAGAEYVYLTETYGRAFGFMSAFVSLVAGFPAAIAAAFKGLALYFFALLPALDSDHPVFGLIDRADLMALVLVWTLIVIQFRGMRGAIRLNNMMTLAKVGGIVVIILAAAAFGNGNVENFSHVSETYERLNTAGTMTALATSLIFVMFCYSGWNAAAYVASEIVEPERNLPRALLAGTLVVTILYLFLNAVYLYGADVDELAGKVEVGLVASRALFGSWGAVLVTIVLIISLFASASAMTIAGPRVYFALGRDARDFRWLSKASEAGVPVNALLLQGVVTSVIILVGRVDEIIQYAGFTLALMSALAVSCVIVLRFRRPELKRPFRVRFYPLPPLIFLGVTLWTMIWAFRGRPVESSLALITVLTGGAIYFFMEIRRRAVVK